jgi:hypothetical protein
MVGRYIYTLRDGLTDPLFRNQVVIASFIVQGYFGWRVRDLTGYLSVSVFIWLAAFAQLRTSPLPSFLCSLLSPGGQSSIVRSHCHNGPED